MMNFEDMVSRLRASWERRRPRKTPILPPVRIDWRQYFADFCIAHGKFPLFDKGRLLFPDGWTYSATDHRGPEWRPPELESERVELCRRYWRLRRLSIRRELPAVMLQIEQLTLLIGTHDVMPYHNSQHWDEAKKAYVPTRAPAKDLLYDAKQRLEWLRDDLELCALKIVNPDAELAGVEK